MTHPEPSGERAATLVRGAISSARLEPQAIDYVNAHGTGTLPNDRMEATALRSALGQAAAQAYVSSSKAQLGHTLGAAAALEAAITVLALRRGEVPPTAGLEEPEEPALRHVMGREPTAPLRAALSCSFGFGGTGSVVLFESADAPRRSGETGVRERSSSPVSRHSEPAGSRRASRSRPTWSPSRQPVRARTRVIRSACSSRRVHAVSIQSTAFVTAVVERALSDARLHDEGTRPRDGDGVRQRRAFGAFRPKGGARRSPRRESRGVPPPRRVRASGNASIYLGLRGPVFAVSDRETSAGKRSSLLPRR